MHPSDLEGLEPDDLVRVTIALEHEEPLQAADIARLLESVSVVHLVGTRQTELIRYDESDERWRPVEDENGFLPESPPVIELNANCTIVLEVIFGVAGVISAAGTVAAGIREFRRWRERRRQARERIDADGLIEEETEADTAAQLATDMAPEGASSVDVTVEPTS